MKSVSRVIVAVIIGLLWIGAAVADEAPISGSVKAVDPAANTLTIETASQGKTRTVTIDIKPASKIVRFARSSEPGKAGFVEQNIALTAQAGVGGLRHGQTRRRPRGRRSRQGRLRTMKRDLISSV